MSDVCVCGHLDLTHGPVDDPDGGECRMFGCGCERFEADDDDLEEVA